MIKKVKAPVRIDFAGGTTDIYPFTEEYGGAVLNAAINKYIVGEITATPRKVSLKYNGNIPTSSGLGTSGVMNLVWLTLISQKKKLDDKTKKELAEEVYNLEQTLGLVGGKQDAYAGAFGGINLWEFKNGVKRKKLKLKEKTIKELENNLLIVYIGEHFSGVVNQAIINNLKKGRNIDKLLRIKEIAYDMKKALEKGDLENFSCLLNEETKNRAELHKMVVTKKTSDIIKKGFKNGAESVKICGAGGGGSVLFYGNKNKLKKVFPNSIEFKFDWKGLEYI